MSTSPGTSDDRLLLRTYAAKGDAAAFAELVRRYADMVYATARRVTGNATTAEDVSQDCFLRLAQSAAAVRGSLAAWLHRTSLNRSLEMRRSERARRAREAATATQATATQAIAPASDDAAELVAKVDEALAALPEELRVVVTEHFLLGRQQGEIAEALGLSQPTVSRRIDKGLAQLRQWLAQSGVAGAAVVPAFFLEAAQVTAPATLRSSLTKIGLSGVGGPVPATAVGALKPAAAVAATLILAIALVAGAWKLLQPPRVSQVTLDPAAAARPANPPAGGPRAVGSTASREDELEFAAVIPQLPARDFAASIAFYQQMGFRLTAQSGTTMLKRDDVRLELIPATANSPAITIRIEVSNVPALDQDFARRKIVRQPSGDPAGTFVVTDPSANKLIFEKERD